MEAKDVLNYLGYDPEKIKSVDELKSTFEKDFVRASTINEDNEFIKPILGKTFGTQENELKKIAKEFEIDLESDDFKEAKKVTDKVKLFTKKVAELKDMSIKDLQTKLSQGTDEKVKEYETKLERTKREAKEKEALLNQTIEEFNLFKQNSANTLKNFKLDIIKKDAFGQIKYNSTANDLSKKGFLATIAEKYEFDLNDNDEPIIRTKGGTQIKSDKVAGSFMTPIEVLQKEAIDMGIYETNPNANKQQAQIKIGANQTPQQANAIPAQAVRQVAPRLG